MATKRSAIEASAETTGEAKRYRSAIDRMADEWICPIAQELSVDPVMAEDGQFYERSAIKKSFKTTDGAEVKSPVTNLPMARTLKTGHQVCNTIKLMVETGAISGAKANLWKKRIEQEAMVTRTRQLCKDGDRVAMWDLGVMYKNGTNGLAKDHTQAFAWMKQAADLDDPLALCCLGQMYCDGYAVQSNSSRGVLCLWQAAALGVNHTCHLLGRLYSLGKHGFDTDATTATYWYKKMSKCTQKHSGETCQEHAAEWLRTHPVAVD